MFRKRLAAAAAAALLTLGLAACGGGDGDDAEQATGPSKLRFLSWPGRRLRSRQPGIVST